VSWLASSITAGDHRNVSVEPALQGLHPPLSHLTAQVIEPRDGSDARWRHLRHHVSQPAYGHHSERDVKARRLEVHALPQDVSGGDATTGSGDHEVTAGGLWPCGPRHAEPTRPRIQVLLGSVAPVGMPLSTAVWSGERADDG
jgi:hypothetical protein